MRRDIPRALSVLGLSLLLGAAQAEQTCRDDILATAPDSRYQDNGDGTVTDLTTGLIWKQCAEGLSGADCGDGSAVTVTWQAALELAKASDPWRLPNNKELASLVERRCVDPAINTRLFPNTTASEFWSVSPIADFSYGAWYVEFYFGSLYDDYGNKSNVYYVRLVRSGQ